MTTEAELKQAIKDAEMWHEASLSDLQAAQASLTPTAAAHREVQVALSNAKAALEKFYLENASVEEVQVTPVMPPDFFAVEYKGEESIPSINVWFKKHGMSDWGLGKGTGYNGKDEVVWLNGDDNFGRKLLQAGNWIVLQEYAYPDNVEVFKNKNQFLTEYKGVDTEE